MIFKHKDNGNIITIDNENVINLLEREGFELVEEDIDEELVALREKAKELGIKAAHTMKKATLITKIAEIEQK